MYIQTKTQMTHPRSRGKSDRAFSDQTQGSLGVSTGGQVSVYQTLRRKGFSTDSSKDRERGLRGTLRTMEATSGDKGANVDCRSQKTPELLPRQALCPCTGRSQSRLLNTASLCLANLSPVFPKHFHPLPRLLSFFPAPVFLLSFSLA